MKNLFKWNPTKDTFIAIASGMIAILLSLCMLIFQGDSVASNISHILFRVILMILIVGFAFPLYYVEIIKNESLAVLGITKSKLKISILLNILLAIGLVFVFMKESTGIITLSYESLCAATYILAAGVFEMVFIYGFLRNYLEKAFGIIPAILLTALIYSFHHAGFQPEFFELFFVGVMYCSVFYITRNIFIMFPFFWGVGATWDVLVDSNAGDGMKNTYGLILAIIIFVSMILISLWIRKKHLHQKPSISVNRLKA